ncbi:MAG: hypothetical protein AAGA87_02495 [Pseudomonadota bacterium]
MTRARILRRAEVERLRAADALEQRLAEEHAQRLAAVEEERAAILQHAQDRAIRESTQTASRIVMDAEAAAQRQLTALEPEVAALVSETVTRVIGAMDQSDAIRRATQQALFDLKDHRRARILAAPDVVDAVRSGVEAAGGAGANVISVEVDERLEAGRTLLSSDQGHVEIGLSDQLDAVTEAFRRTDP